VQSLTAPSVARGTLGRGRLRSTRFRLASGETVRPVGTHDSHVQLPDFSVSHAAYRGSRAHYGGSNTEGHLHARDCESHDLAASAGEDWAALSGRPRKASASQYAIVMQQCAPGHNRDASTRSLAAGAEEDRAALSGRPRKANASQYAGVMQKREQPQSPSAYFRCNSSFLVCPAVNARHTGAPRHSW
jgi:hypothetical protein